MAEPFTFPATQRYIAFDLSNGSTAAQELMSCAEQEASLPRLDLTGDGDSGAISANLTGAMVGWVAGTVGFARQESLAELEAAARRITLGKAHGGVLIELEEDKLKRDREHRRNDIYAEFHDRHASAIRECEEIDEDYDRMRIREGGRDAQVPNKLLEWGVLFPLVLIPESLLNFESFRRAPIISSDAMALGVTILVGFGIAIAAHFYGTFIKQFNYWIRPDDDEQQGRGLRYLELGTALLSVSLAMVAAARYYYLLPLWEQAIILGQSPPNFFVQLGGTLIGNIVVFMIGSALSYKLHDRNPEFSDLKAKLERARANLDHLRKEQATNKLSEIDARLKREIDNFRHMAAQMNGKPGYSELREQFSRFHAKDQQVIGILKRYQNDLANKITRRDPDFLFERAYIGAGRGGEKMSVTLAEFVAAPLYLYKA